MNRLFFASLFTLAILFSFVCAVIILIMLYIGKINLWFAIGLTIIINFVLWLVGPAITDLINKWCYRVRFLSKKELEKEHPQIEQIIEKVSQKYKFKFPKVGIIPDKIPLLLLMALADSMQELLLLKGFFIFSTKENKKR